jgi:hypothetical protein
MQNLSRQSEVSKKPLRTRHSLPLLHLVPGLVRIAPLIAPIPVPKARIRTLRNQVTQRRMLPVIRPHLLALLQLSKAPKLNQNVILVLYLQFQSMSRSCALFTAYLCSVLTYFLSRKQPTILVPPGQGKPATQNRNLRRRRKKQYERLAAEQALSGMLGVNNIPLGLGTLGMPADAVNMVIDDDAIVPTSSHGQNPQTFMMASLSNKNKRKGFKQAMTSNIPKKIVFSDPDGTSSTVQEPILPFSASTAAEVAAAAPDNSLRLVPPSERQENGQLPANMIVTSIDVDEGLYPIRKKDKKKYSPPQLRRSETQEVENVILNYDDGDADMIPTQRTPVITKAMDKSVETQGFLARDWQRIEEKWETLRKISDAARVAKGSLVGWKVCC